MLKIIKKILQLFGILESDKDKYAREQGEKGESAVSQVFKDNNIKYLSNIYLPHKYGYTEIDLLIITRVGLFVTEVKNYNNCEIIGTEEDEKWEVKYKSGKIYDMYNPIKQNDGHIRTLLRYIDNRASQYIYSLIVFSDNADLRVQSVRNGVYVINEKDLTKFISKINSNRDNLTTEEIKVIYKQLEVYTGVTDRIKKEHKKNVKNYVKQKRS